MEKVLSFGDFVQKANEDLVGENGNYAPGTEFSPNAPWNRGEVEDSRGINSSRHNLRLVSTDLSEFAVLEDKATGKPYVFYFDPSSPEFLENYAVYDEGAEEYLAPDELGIEAAANDVPKMEIGYGSDDWESGVKPLVELDEELTDDLLDDFAKYVTQGNTENRTSKMKVMKSLESILQVIRSFTESLEFEADETISEAEGIHPAIRDKILAYLKDNTDATYAEAKKYIGEKIHGWKLSEEDFEEAQKTM